MTFYLTVLSRIYSGIFGSVTKSSKYPQVNNTFVVIKTKKRCIAKHVHWSYIIYSIFTILVFHSAKRFEAENKTKISNNNNNNNERVRNKANADYRPRSIMLRWSLVGPGQNKTKLKMFGLYSRYRSSCMWFE